MSNPIDPWQPQATTEPPTGPFAPAGEPGPATVRLTVPVHAPLWSWVLLGTIMVIFLAMTAMGGSESTDTLVRFGAKYSPLIVQGEYWRLLTANFLHIGILHLLFNAYALYIIGPQVESRYGRARFLVLYLLAGIAGAVLSFVGSRALSAGASGAIFGLIGAITVYFASYRKVFGAAGRRQLSNLLMVMGFNLLWGLLNPRIDNLGHVGGLLAGLALGWAYMPLYDISHGPGGPSLAERHPRPREVAVTVALVAVLVGMALLGTHIHGQGLARVVGP